MKHTNDKKDVVLVVDDVEINRVILREMLQDDYKILEATGGTQALDILFDEKQRDGMPLPTVVLLDKMMPDLDGFQVLERIKSDNRTKNIPVLVITAEDSEEIESKGLHIGAADYITKPFNNDIVKARITNHISLAQYSHNLEELVEEKTAEVTRSYESTLEVLATIIEYRNLESGAHIRRTVLFTETMVNKMLELKKYRDMLGGENIPAMIKASALHDIGKIGIPDSVLLKPGRLTEEEYEIIKEHTNIGGKIIDSIAQNMPDNDQYMRYAKEICLYHHERWDGNGYPSKIAGDAIPVSARIISIVDVYDALTSVRCYKGAFSHEESVEIIKEGKGTQFDPGLVDILVNNEKDFHEIEEAYKDR